MNPSVCIANRIIVVLLVESIYDTKVIVCSCPLRRYWQAKTFAISADGSKTRVIKQEFPPRFMARPPTRPACKAGCQLLLPEKAHLDNGSAECRERVGLTCVFRGLRYTTKKKKT